MSTGMSASRDLVFASTYWSLPTRQLERVFAVHAELSTPPAALPAPGRLHLPERSVLRRRPFHRLQGADAVLRIPHQPRALVGRAAAVVQTGRAVSLAGGLYWEKTRDKNSGSTYYMPGLQNTAQRFSTTLSYYGTRPRPSLPPGVWYGYISAPITCRPPNSPTSASMSPTSSMSKRASCIFIRISRTTAPTGSSPISPPPDALGRQLAQVEQQGRHQLQAHRQRDGVRRFRAGLPRRRHQRRLPGVVLRQRRAADYTPDTLNNFEVGWKTTSLDGRLLWNGAVYYMNWKNLQTLIYDIDVCPSCSFNTNVGDARIYGVESNVDFKLNDNWSVQASGSYTDAHLISSTVRDLPGQRRRAAAVRAVFQLELECALRAPAAAATAAAMPSSTWPTRATCGTICTSPARTACRACCSPSYTIMNLRFGLNPDGDRWLAEFYVTNLADKNAIVYSNTGNFDLRADDQRAARVRLRLNYRFGKTASGGGGT